MSGALTVDDRVQWMKLPGYALGTVEHVGPSGGATGQRVLAPAAQFRRIDLRPESDSPGPDDAGGYTSVIPARKSASDELRADSGPAERLRRAADLVEQRAAAASGPRWKPEYGYGHTTVQAVECDGDGCGHDSYGHVDGTCAIGAMHADGDNQWAILAGPQVAPPLAAWLRAEADDAELIASGNLFGSFDKATTVRALALADVILGGGDR